MTAQTDATLWILTLLLATGRTAGVVLMAPPMGHRLVPLRVRLMLAGVLGLAVLGRLARPLAAPVSASMLLGGLGGELLIGLTIGFAARAVFLGVQLGATHIAQQIGVALGDALNPNATSAANSLRGLFDLLAVVLFLLLGGADALMGAMMNTFAVVAPGTPPAVATLLNTVTGLLGVSFLLGLKVAGPVLAAMILAAVAIGTLQRVLPQCHTFTVGLPVRTLLGLVVLAGSLAVMPALVESAWAAATNILTTRLIPGL